MPQFLPFRRSNSIRLWCWSTLFTSAISQKKIKIQNAILYYLLFIEDWRDRTKISSKLVWVLYLEFPLINFSEAWEECDKNARRSVLITVKSCTQRNRNSAASLTGTHKNVNLILLMDWDTNLIAAFNEPDNLLCSWFARYYDSYKTL